MRMIAQKMKTSEVISRNTAFRLIHRWYLEHQTVVNMRSFILILL